MSNQPTSQSLSTDPESQSSSTGTGDQSSANSKSGTDDVDQSNIRKAANEYQEYNGQPHPIAEFLYQLTKMLTDDNSEIIEWSNVRIKVHEPKRLESEVLHKYFRHAKFSSFQRQLNYFGFRKIAGKGKMSPCSYVNDAATSDVRSLLFIKRKTHGSAARKAIQQEQLDRAALFGAIQAGFGGALGMQQIPALQTHAISSAMALLQENAFRAGLGQGMVAQAQQQNRAGLITPPINLMTLQQQEQLQRLKLQHSLHGQQQLLLLQNQIQNSGAPIMLNQAPATTVVPGANQGRKLITPSIPGTVNGAAVGQLQAQLMNSFHSILPNFGQTTGAGEAAQATLTQTSTLNPTSTALSKASGTTTGCASMRASSAVGQIMPASDSMNSNPSLQHSLNPFGSSMNLESLIKEHSAGAPGNVFTQTQQDMNNSAGTTTTHAGLPSESHLNHLPP